MVKNYIRRRLMALLCSASLVVAGITVYPSYSIADGGIGGETDVSGTQDEETKVSINDIFDRLIKDGSSYDVMKKMYVDSETGEGPLIFSEKCEDNHITLSIEAVDKQSDMYESYKAMEGTWTYKLADNYITYEGKKEDFTGLILYSYVVDAVIDVLGMDRYLAKGYINVAAYKNIDNEYYIITEDKASGDISIKVFVAGKWDIEDDINSIYLDNEIMAQCSFAALTENYNTSYLQAGRLIASVSGNVYSADITVAEYGDRSELTYNSIIELIKYLKPAGYEAFIKNYKKLAEVSTDVYTVTYPAKEEDIPDSFKELSSSFKFVKVHFDKGNAVLKKVYEALTSSDSYFTGIKEAYSSSGIEFNAELADGAIDITSTDKTGEDNNSTWCISLDGDFLTYTIWTDNIIDYAVVDSSVTDAVSKVVGIDKEEFKAYISAVAWKNTDNSLYICESDVNAGLKSVRIYVGDWNNYKKQINSVLNSTWIDENILAAVEPLSEESVNTIIRAGRIAAYWLGNKNSVDIVIGEHGDITEKIYKSVMELVKKLQPAGYESFLENYKELEVVTADGYKVSFVENNEEIPEVMTSSLDKHYEYVKFHFEKKTASASSDNTQVSSGTTAQTGSTVSTPSSATPVIIDNNTVTDTGKDAAKPSIKVAGKKFNSKKTYTIKKKKILKVTITGKKKGTKNKYSTSNKKVAKVISGKTASTVKIKGLKKGKATIGMTVDGVNFKIKVKVK